MTRKRRRQSIDSAVVAEGGGDDNDYDDKTDGDGESSITRGSATGGSRNLVDRLRVEIARRDAVIRQQHVEIARMQQSLALQTTAAYVGDDGAKA